MMDDERTITLEIEDVETTIQLPAAVMRQVHQIVVEDVQTTTSSQMKQGGHNG